MLAKKKKFTVYDDRTYFMCLISIHKQKIDIEQKKLKQEIEGATENMESVCDIVDFKS